VAGVGIADPASASGGVPGVPAGRRLRLLGTGTAAAAGGARNGDEPPVAHAASRRRPWPPAPDDAPGKGAIFIAALAPSRIHSAPPPPTTVFLQSRLLAAWSLRHAGHGDYGSTLPSSSPGLLLPRGYLHLLAYLPPFPLSSVLLFFYL
jgi:hypothetical protein